MKSFCLPILLLCLLRSVTSNEKNGQFPIKSHSFGLVRNPAWTQLEGGASISREGEEEANTSHAIPSITQFHFGPSTSGDGSESDPDGIPTRFLQMQKGHRRKAKKAFETTVAWREANEINTILSKPQPNYDQCRHVFPLMVVGRTPKTDHIIFFQQPGRVNLTLGADYRFGLQDIMMNYVFMMEYIWNIFEQDNHNATMVNIIDFSGLGFLTPKDFGFAKHFISIMSTHYPGRSFKTFILNGPGWFARVYALVKPLLRPSTRQKIVVVEKHKEREILEEFLGKDHASVILDRCRNNASLTRSTMDEEIRNFCLQRLEASGLKMLETIRL